MVVSQKPPTKHTTDLMKATIIGLMTSHGLDMSPKRVAKRLVDYGFTTAEAKYIAAPYPGEAGDPE